MSPKVHLGAEVRLVEPAGLPAGVVAIPDRLPRLELVGARRLQHGDVFGDEEPDGVSVEHSVVSAHRQAVLVVCDPEQHRPGQRPIVQVECLIPEFADRDSRLIRTCDVLRARLAPGICRDNLDDLAVSNTQDGTQCLMTLRHQP